MLITTRQLQRYWNLQPETLLHVGAHHAEELDDYLASSWGTQSVVWVEAMPAAIETCRRKLSHLPNHILLEAVAWSQTGVQVEFHQASNGQSSSVLDLGTHSVSYPEITYCRSIPMTTTALSERLDELGIGDFDLINLDIQGAELEALKGLGGRVRRAKAIYSEVNTREVYRGCASLQEMDAWLSLNGFRLVDKEMTPAGWGDALWLRRDQIPRLRAIRRSSRRALQLLDRVSRRLVPRGTSREPGSGERR